MKSFGRQLIAFSVVTLASSVASASFDTQGGTMFADAADGVDVTFFIEGKRDAEGDSIVGYVEVQGPASWCLTVRATATLDGERLEREAGRIGNDASASHGGGCGASTSEDTSTSNESAPPCSNSFRIPRSYRAKGKTVGLRIDDGVATVVATLRVPPVEARWETPPDAALQPGADVTIVVEPPPSRDETSVSFQTKDGKELFQIRPHATERTTFPDGAVVEDAGLSVTDRGLRFRVPPHLGAAVGDLVVSSATWSGVVLECNGARSCGVARRGHPWQVALPATVVP